MRFLAGISLALVVLVAHAGEARADASEEYTQDEIYSAASGFFGEVTEGLAKVIEKAFEEQGRPNAFIKGEEAAGAIVVGLRYGNGTLVRKTTGDQKIYWQGPSVGFDLGGNASKVFILAYNLGESSQLYQRIPSVDGSAYFIAGAGVNYLRASDVVLAPIRTGVGFRLGANIGYLHFGATHSWNPF